MPEAIQTLISTAFSDLESVATTVVTLAVPVTVSVIALTSGVNFALKKIKGVLSKAS